MLKITNAFELQTIDLRVASGYNNNPDCLDPVMRKLAKIPKTTGRKMLVSCAELNTHSVL